LDDFQLYSKSKHELNLNKILPVNCKFIRDAYLQFVMHYSAI